MIAVLHERAWPRDAEQERAGAPYVVAFGEAATPVSRHATTEAALEAARAQGAGAVVWRKDDLAELGNGGPVAEIVEG